MLLLAGVALAIQIHVQDESRSTRPPVVRDSTPRTAADSGPAGMRRGRRLPVTAAVLATAYRNADARPLLLSARGARLAQDSALRSYDATAYQRLSFFVGIGEGGRRRLVYRNESASRIQWKHDVGVWIDMRGARAGIPMAPTHLARDEMRGDIHDDQMSPVPYYPGYEALWIGGGTARAQVDETDLVNPLADGAEAYYTYEAGDSTTIRLPDGKVTRLRELEVRPRNPTWNLVVGSLWMDANSGQLVRAAYRLTVPADILVATQQDSSLSRGVTGVARGLLSPMRGQVSAIAIEYGLHEGRFWLPRMRAAEGTAQVSFTHVSFRSEQSFRYAGINTVDSLPPIIVPAAIRRARLDSMTPDARQRWLDSTAAADRASRVAVRDSIARGERPPIPRERPCPDSAAGRTVMRERYGSVRLKVGLRYPCDVSTLENSPDLPPSIYDAGDELFGAKERDALVAEALSLGAQSPLLLGQLPPPVIRYGLQLVRYNRVEGLSVGVGARQELGGGYAADGTARLGLADREPNLELFLSRSNMATTIRLGAYHRLVSASDWGRPLSFGSSVSALLFGRDEGFYYRAAGGEASGTSEALFSRGARLDWRLFLEGQRTALQRTDRSIGGDFPANILATDDTYAGGAVAVQHVRGLDPRGFRLQSALRLEAAASGSAYGRAAAELTASRGFGPLAGALTAAAGSSTGTLPSHRRWFLGGSKTVRGQNADTAQAGNAFWLTRAEIGTGASAARVAVFGDVGWAGDRTRLRRIGRPMSGVGIGTSFADGLVRLDVARGLFPRKQWRLDLSLDARF